MMHFLPKLVQAKLLNEISLDHIINNLPQKFLHLVDYTNYEKQNEVAIILLQLLLLQFDFGQVEVSKITFDEQKIPILDFEQKKKLFNQLDSVG